VNEKVQTATPAQLVEEYIKLRDQRKIADEAYAAWVKEHYSVKMETLENQLLDVLNKLDVNSISSSSGTVYKKMSTSVTVADSREFRRHVIGSEEWDLIDWRANKTAVNDMVERGDALPPGINRTAIMTVGIRRK